MPSTPTGVAEGAEQRSPTISLTLSREHLVVAAIVVGQALWLGMVMRRGWYSAADLPNIAYATGRPLDWDYLTSTLGGHFGVAQRLVYWVLNRAAPLEWWVTILIRLTFQALTTVLLWKLFRDLVGPRTWLWVVLVGYASSPYLVPGTAALNSGLGLEISQACLVGALLAHVRYARERRLGQAVLVAVLVLVMLAFAQGSLPALVFLPVLSLFFLQQGSWRERLRGELLLWRGWLLLGLALVAFAGLYLTGDYNSPSSEFTTPDALWLAGQAWLVILGPALVGGPWRFSSLPDQWSAYADPPLAVLVLGQVALIGLIVLSVRRSGKIALVAWAIPVWTAMASLVLVGVGRWWWLGEVIPSALRYSHFVPVALALGVVLAFGGQPIARSVTRSDRRAWSKQRQRALVGGAAGLLVAASAYSTWKFAEVFWENPADEYTAALLSDTEERGPDVQVFDTLLPESIVPYVSQMYVSDLLALGGASAQVGGQSNNRLTVDTDGRLVAARFLKVSDFFGPAKKSCGIHVYGEGTTRIPLSLVTQSKEWFLQLELYQPKDNRVTMTVLDDDGQELTIHGDGSTLDLRGSLVVLHRRLETGRPATIEIEATDPETNFCLVHTFVGVPVT
jgi:hypothetical protein